MFKNAQTLGTPAAPKAKGKQKTERAIAGVKRLAMVDALAKALDAVKESFRGMVLAEAVHYFRVEIDEHGRKPESFRAIEDGAAATIEFRKRGSNFGLNEAQVATLRAAGFEPGREVIVPALFGINPKYAGNAELLDKVAERCADIVPKDFIVTQAEQVKYIVTDELLADVLAKRAAPEVVTVCTSLAIKPALKAVSMEQILEFVRELLTPAPVAPAANEPGKERAAA